MNRNPYDLSPFSSFQRTMAKSYSPNTQPEEAKSAGRPTKDEFHFQFDFGIIFFFFFVFPIY